MEQLIDYAMPTMKAEEALKKLHWAFLDGKLDVAAEMAVEAAKQAFLAYQAIKHAQRQETTHP